MSVESVEWRQPSRAPSLAAAMPPSGVRFVDDATRELLCAQAAAARSIVLRPRAERAGSLARAIDADFESALAIRGALPPPLSDDARLIDSLHDQLRRARLLPARGVCLVVPRLVSVTDGELVLGGGDGRYLAAFLRAAWDGVGVLPILVLVAESDRFVALPVPKTLDDIVTEELARVDAECAGLFASSERVIAAITGDAADEGVIIPDLQALGGRTRATIEPLFVEPVEEAATAAAEPPAPAEPPTLAVAAEPEAPIAKTLAPPAAEPDAEVAEPSPAPLPIPGEGRSKGAEPSVAVEPEPIRRATAVTERDLAREARDAAEAEALRAERVLLAAAHRAHALELDAARGPKPVSTIERLYANHYVPLIGARHRGEADQTACDIASEWSRSFAESYAESFVNIRVTGKRPPMVFDAFDIATRIGRLSSARNVKLVLVDAMSFDLAERVASRMKAELDKRAVLLERTTLWAALPSTTPTAMHLLARGPDGLRDAPVSSPEPDIVRGRSITTMRRERLGARELMKLDLVEARLHTPGVAYDERLDALADEVTDLVTMFMETLPPRTLLYVFGDHGFLLGPGPRGSATGPAVTGGASPDEVLVAGHAWLVDAMQ